MEIGDRITAYEGQNCKAKWHNNDSAETCLKKQSVTISDKLMRKKTLLLFIIQLNNYYNQSKADHKTVIYMEATEPK